ncbi:hypothetical protein D3C77_787120 [compost metagenome]
MKINNIYNMPSSADITNPFFIYVIALPVLPSPMLCATLTPVPMNTSVDKATAKFKKKLAVPIAATESLPNLPTHIMSTRP